MFVSSSIATRLEYQHKTILELTEDLSDEQVRQQVVEGKWTIFENIVHLVTYQHAFLRRLNQILEEDQPSFQRYSAESDPLFYVNSTKTTREVMQDLVITRKLLVSTIFSLTKDQLQRKGNHPVYGEMNIMNWTEFFLLHESHHLFTIFKLAGTLRM